MTGDSHVVLRTAERLDQYLAGLLPAFSRTQVQRLITGGHVRLNQAVVVRPGARLHPGDQLAWELPAPPPAELVPELIPLTIVYEDEDLAVIDKPAGLVVHPAPGHATGTLVHALLARGDRWSAVGGAERPGIVHRLDKDTSGLLVVARNDAAHRGLAEQLAAHAMRRGYRAIVVGELAEPAARIEAAIGRDPRHRQRMAVVARGRMAVTELRRLGVAGGHSLLALTLFTGRTHQVRVHLAYIHHPLLGDAVYGRRSPLITRPALHAAELAFRHPRTGRLVSYTSLPPADFRAAWESLGGQILHKV